MEENKTTGDIQVSDFINSIPLEGKNLVPSNIKGASCLAEVKFSKEI